MGFRRPGLRREQHGFRSQPATHFCRRRRLFRQPDDHRPFRLHGGTIGAGGYSGRRRVIVCAAFGSLCQHAAAFYRRTRARYPRYCLGFWGSGLRRGEYSSRRLGVSRLSRRRLHHHRNDQKPPRLHRRNEQSTHRKPQSTRRQYCARDAHTPVRRTNPDPDGASGRNGLPVVGERRHNTHPLRIGIRPVRRHPDRCRGLHLRTARRPNRRDSGAGDRHQRPGEKRSGADHRRCVSPDEYLFWRRRAPHHPGCGKLQLHLDDRQHGRRTTIFRYPRQPAEYWDACVLCDDYRQRNRLHGRERSVYFGGQSCPGAVHHQPKRVPCLRGRRKPPEPKRRTRTQHAVRVEYGRNRPCALHDRTGDLSPARNQPIRLRSRRRPADRAFRAECSRPALRLPYAMQTGYALPAAPAGRDCLAVVPGWIAGSGGHKRAIYRTRKRYLLGGTHGHHRLYGAKRPAAPGFIRRLRQYSRRGMVGRKQQRPY